MNRGEFLKSWMKDAGLSLEKVGLLAKLEPSVVDSIVSGTGSPSFEDLDAVARVLFLRPEEIFEEQVQPSAPHDGVRLLMKSAEAYHPTEVVRLRMLEAAAASRDLLDLTAELRPRGGGFEKFSSRPLGSNPVAPYKLGDALAQEVRRQLHLRGPIASMRDLARETLGIPIIAADLTSSGPDAFSVYAPGRRAVIVINLRGKNKHALVRRFSIAHEVGHVLFDRPGSGAFGVTCRVEQGREIDIESRANAFAMRLLLPYQPVTRLGRDVLLPEKFRGLMEHWGVHFSALKLYAEKVLGLSRDEAQEAIPEVDRSAPNRWTEAEELPEQRPGLEVVPMPRRGPLLALVLKELRADRISYARARELLDLEGVVSLDELAVEADEA